MRGCHDFLSGGERKKTQKYYKESFLPLKIFTLLSVCVFLKPVALPPGDTHTHQTGASVLFLLLLLGV